MTGPHETLKHAGDIGASITSAFVVMSNFAALATPIVTFLIALATLAWWTLRFVGLIKGGRNELD